MHYPIQPSRLYLTRRCNGHVKLEAIAGPLPDTPEAAEGRAAHWVAMRYAAGYAAELPQGVTFDFEGRQWTVDADMAAGAALYLRAVGGFQRGAQLEITRPISRIHGQCGGTGDFTWCIRNAMEAYLACPPEFPPDLFWSGTLQVIRGADYKYGFRKVEAFECDQVSAYISGVMQSMGFTERDPTLYFEILIIQPRSYGRDGQVRTWRGHVSQLGRILDECQRAAQAALSDNPQCTVNEFCGDCKARHICSTLQYAAGQFIEFSGAAEAVEMQPVAIGTELAMVQDAIERLKARETGLAAKAESYVRQGQVVGNFHMEQGDSRLTYKDNVNVEELIFLGDACGVNLRKEQTKKSLLVTPTQGIQMGIDESVMSAYADRPPAGKKLTRDDPLTVRKVFNR